jgi:hypothetical protein
MAEQTKKIALFGKVLNYQIRQERVNIRPRNPYWIRILYHDSIRVKIRRFLKKRKITF